MDADCSSAFFAIGTAAGYHVARMARARASRGIGSGGIAQIYKMDTCLWRILAGFFLMFYFLVF